MADIAIIGDGPGGLSAALFLAKNGHQATVYGTGESAVNFAQLHNYLGLPDTSGTDFVALSRAHAADHGARFVDSRVEAVLSDGSQFKLVAENGAAAFADYLVLSEGKNPAIGPALGAEVDETGAVVVDRDQRTSLPRVYAVGRMTRPRRSQVIISAGAGAVAALDILAAEAGSDIQDWDKPVRE